MNQNLLNELVRESRIVKSFKDVKRADSLTGSAKRIATAISHLPVTDETAEIIFKEMYDAFHQIANAKLWMEGYNPKDHVASMKVLLSAEIASSHKLNQVDRYRKLRNDAIYEGKAIIKIEDAKGIILLWNDISEELFAWVKKP